MQVHVLNSCIDLWRSWCAVKEPLDTLRMKREVLGQQMRLRPCDIDQHLVNTMRREAGPKELQYAKETICEVLNKLNDRDVICDIYRSLFDILEKAEKDRKSSIMVFNVTNNTADVDAKIQRLKEEAVAFQNEVIAHREHIERMKNRTWWQRLLNKDV